MRILWSDIYYINVSSSTSSHSWFCWNLSFFLNFPVFQTLLLIVNNIFIFPKVFHFSRIVLSQRIFLRILMRHLLFEFLLDRILIWWIRKKTILIFALSFLLFECFRLVNFVDKHLSLPSKFSFPLVFFVFFVFLSYFPARLSSLENLWIYNRWNSVVGHGSASHANW